MHIVYKITYLPHLDTIYPKYYIGSKYNYNGNYFGSISSKKKFDFTNGYPLRDWWKLQQQQINNFKFDILEQLNDNATPGELVTAERKIQEQYIESSKSEYFNQCYALKGFFSTKKSDFTKKILSTKLKQFWNSKEGVEKKKRLSERNKLTKSEELKSKWLDNEYREHIIKKFKNKKLSIEHKQKIKIAKCKDIEYKGSIYCGWDDLYSKTKVTKHLYQKYYLNGFEPEVNIGNNINPLRIPLQYKKEIL